MPDQPDQLQGGTAAEREGDIPQTHSAGAPHRECWRSLRSRGSAAPPARLPACRSTRCTPRRPKTPSRRACSSNAWTRCTSGWRPAGGRGGPRRSAAGCGRRGARGGARGAHVGVRGGVPRDGDAGDGVGGRRRAQGQGLAVLDLHGRHELDVGVPLGDARLVPRLGEGDDGRDIPYDGGGRGPRHVEQRAPACAGGGRGGHGSARTRPWLRRARPAGACPRLLTVSVGHRIGDVHRSRAGTCDSAAGGGWRLCSKEVLGRGGGRLRAAFGERLLA